MITCWRSHQPELPAEPVAGRVAPGPIPDPGVRVCILAGIIVATVITCRRWAAQCGRVDDVVDVVTWAVPFGIVGGRVYHVITDPELYFAAGRDPVRAL